MIPPTPGGVMSKVMGFLRGDSDLVGCRFAVNMDGQLVAVFKECSGLNGEIEVETYQEGGVNDYEHKLPGRTKFGNVTLGSGISNAFELWDWFYQTSKGAVERRNLSIIMYLQDRGEAMRWNLKEVCPVRWEGPSLNADDNSVAISSLELAHHGIELR